MTLRLVDWADEEGARFGRSLFGSSAAAGTLEPDDVRDLKDKDGVALPDALAEHGVDLDRINESRSQLENAAAYLELHIEQGPVLERMDYPLGVVLGTFGVERHAVRFTGQHAHSGSTPMDVRRDAFIAAARSAIEFRDDAARRDDVRATTGFVNVSPAIVTAFNGWCEMSLDQRALDPVVLANMLDAAQEATERIAQEEGVSVEWERLWRIEPILFDEELIELAEEAVRRGGRQVAPAAQRPPARRGLHGAPHADGHALRQEPQGPEPHQRRGHAGRRPRALGAGAAPSRGQDDGLGRRVGEAGRGKHDPL